MSDRGEYRSMFCSFWDDADVHAMSDAAYRVLTTLKGTLPWPGIGIVYLSLLAERCGKSVAQVEDALDELTIAKQGEALGWIVRERNVIWIVNSLRYAPTVSASNRHHRAFVRERVLAPLGEKLAIVRAFRAYYPDWIDAGAMGSNTPSNPIEMGSQSIDDAREKGTRSTTDAASISSRRDFDQNQLTVNSNSNSKPNEKPNQTNQYQLKGSSAAEESAVSAVQLAVWSNQAVTERWGEQTRPLTPATACELEEQVAKLGIDANVVRDSILRQCRGSTKKAPPSSVKYFARGVVEDWDAELMRRQVATAPSLEGQSADPVLSKIDEMIAIEKSKSTKLAVLHA